MSEDMEIVIDEVGSGLLRLPILLLQAPLAAWAIEIWRSLTTTYQIPDRASHSQCYTIKDTFLRIQRLADESASSPTQRLNTDRGVLSKGVSMALPPSHHGYMVNSTFDLCLEESCQAKTWRCSIASSPLIPAIEQPEQSHQSPKTRQTSSCYPRP